jgi:hypothetical protein
MMLPMTNLASKGSVHFQDISSQGDEESERGEDLESSSKRVKILTTTVRSQLRLNIDLKTDLIFFQSGHTPLLLILQTISISACSNFPVSLAGPLLQ